MSTLAVTSEDAAATHFKHYFYAAVVSLVRHAVDVLGDLAVIAERFPFLAGYVNELAANGLAGVAMHTAPEAWRRVIAATEAGCVGHLPLRALRDAHQLEHEDLVLLLGAGLIEEDARFGALFETLLGRPGELRPRAGTLAACCNAGDGVSRVRSLCELGLLRADDPRMPAAAWAIYVPDAIWRAARGDPRAALPGTRRRTQATLPSAGELVLAPEVERMVGAVPALIGAGEIDALIVRGLPGTGRRTAIGAIARALGKDLLEIALPVSADVATILPAFTTMADALPVFIAQPAPGEVVRLPDPLPCGPIAAVMGGTGGLEGTEQRRMFQLQLGLPAPPARDALWHRVLPAAAPALRTELVARYRISARRIADLAQRAKVQAMMAGRPEVGWDDIVAADQQTGCETLETLATRLATRGDWDSIVVGAETMAELTVLEARCRARDRLGALTARPAAVPANAGVRALLKGPSGTGKTLAARVLAARLGLQIYRVDLGAVVSKYIGETEKNLGRVLDAAETMNFVLLFDEGDALFGQRTGVHTANDRYANLETNFLLQRIESFEGIVLITTNLGDALDRAFERRMDVVVQFHPPQTSERLAIWQLHLPADHRVSAGFLAELASRCVLSGGQIRNAALHAALLAIDSGCGVGDEELGAAVRREYRKRGAMCPLRAAA